MATFAFFWEQSKAFDRGCPSASLFSLNYRKDSLKVAGNTQCDMIYRVFPGR